jgi:MarR family transcriptional regulator, 2-MHQ and catechol-resistance regulon repressor
MTAVAETTTQEPGFDPACPRTIPMSEPHQGAWNALVRAHAALRGRLQQALVEAGLPPLPWFELLAALDRSEEEGLKMSDIAEALILTPGGTTKLVDRLVRSGLVERGVCETDRRLSYAHITEAGREILAEMSPVITSELESTFVEPLAADEARAIADGLERVRNLASAP